MMTLKVNCRATDAGMGAHKRRTQAEADSYPHFLVTQAQAESN
jgi:hypothetical protein